MTRRSRARGFTMLELLMAVAIVIVLVVVALPSYRRMMERGYLRQAEDLLLTIYSGERAYFLVNDAYRNNPASMADWRLIHMDDPNLTGIPVTFAVVAAGTGAGATFTATATRAGGPCSGNSRTIDQNRTLVGSWPSCGAL